MSKASFLVAGDHTHFRHNTRTNTVECTHGGWEGIISFNEDGSCDVDVGFKSIHYDSFEIVEESSIDSYLERKQGESDEKSK